MAHFFFPEGGKVSSWFTQVLGEAGWPAESSAERTKNRGKANLLEINFTNLGLKNLTYCTK